MTFRNHKRIRPCLPLMLEEITALRPDLIVLQGRALGAGDPYSEPFFKITGDNHGTIGRLYFANWPDGWRSIIVSFSHPSRGHLDRHWETEIVPALNEARRLLEDAR
jgi:hypothetical protein